MRGSDSVCVTCCCSVRMEKARELAEQRAQQMQQTVERMEQALLSEKMVRKLKESCIQRMTQRGRKGTAASAPTAGAAAASEETATEAPTPNNAEELRQEIEVLRRELDQVPLESVK